MAAAEERGVAATVVGTELPGRSDADWEPVAAFVDSDDVADSEAAFTRRGSTRLIAIRGVSLGLAGAGGAKPQAERRKAVARTAARAELCMGETPGAGNARGIEGSASGAQ
ncbi:hypothetical protein A7J71_19610 [Achromobacter insolitus]|nr:hypothetical protein A7J71_19610 [Achromobacter insolitus]OCZ57856.1 hypothetical protein A7P22_11915 [Achromobacter insolitus]